jgi:hypothetical protein
MSILAERTDVIHTIAGCRPGTKTRSTYINGIGTVVNSRDATLQILGRCQQFQFPHLLYSFTSFSPLLLTSFTSSTTQSC